MFVFRQEVENDCYPHLWRLRNSDGRSVDELFEENHLDLRRQAENAAKYLSSNGVVLTILIGTITFAALFTLPGGFDQNTSRPMPPQNRCARDGALHGLHCASCFFLFLFFRGSNVSPAITIWNQRFSHLDTAETVCFQNFHYLLHRLHLCRVLPGLSSCGWIRTSLILFFFPLLGITSSMVFLALMMELIVLLFDYLYYVIRNQLAYKSPEMWRLSWIKTHSGNSKRAVGFY